VNAGVNRVESMTQQGRVGWRCRRKSGSVGVLVAFAALAAVASAQTVDLPEPPDETDFAALREASPFGRVLDPAATFSLRGVAVLDDLQVATLHNRETDETFTVTPDETNEEGIRLVEIVPARRLEGVAARISFAGREVALRYDAGQHHPEPEGGARSRGDRRGRGDDGDGRRRRGPSREDIERFRALSDENRGKLRQYIRQTMERYPDMPREERANMIRGALTRLSDGRELDVGAPNGDQDRGARGDR